MSIIDTVTSTFSNSKDWGQSGNTWKGDGGGNTYDGGKGDHAGGNESGGGTEGGKSFDLSSLTKDTNIDASTRYDQKDFNEKTTYESESSSKDNGDAVTKSGSEFESYESKDGKNGGESFDSGSEYKYSDKDFGESSHSSESYFNEVDASEKSFESDFSFDKSIDTVSQSFDSFTSSQDSLIG